jgi:YHS domain-containing protein
MNRSRAFLQQILLAAGFLLLPGSATFAQSDSSKTLRVVLQGHDPVAYFTESKPVKGDPKISYEWDGERYLFANAGNRGKFAANPERYTPQFGGYCTGTMAGGRGRAEADPEAWIIADGRLYLFGQVKFRDIAAKDSAGFAKTVMAANQNWPAKK